MTKDELMGHVENVAALLHTDPKDGKALYSRLLKMAKKLKCKTEFAKAVQVEQKRLKAQAALDALAADGKVPIFRQDENTLGDELVATGQVVAKERAAFSFGGVPVAMQDYQSSIAFVYERDASGRKLRDADGKAITTPAIITKATPLNTATAHLAALSCCGFFKQTQNGPVPVPAPKPSMMSDAWAHLLPPLSGIATYPVMHEGELLVGEGYHDATRLYLQSTGVESDWEPDLFEAIEYLRQEWLGGFTFASETDFATALMIPASMLHSRTTLVDAFGPPFFGVTAPTAGIGKSLLAEALASAVTGRIPATLAYPESEEEREKRFSVAILEGWPLLLLDNLTSGGFIDSKHRTLTQLITSPIWSGRVLGLTRGFEGPAGIVVVGTGNNLLFAGDMARRTLECRLVAPDDQNLATREFKHTDLLKFTKQNRGKILAALQVVMKVKATGKPIGGFPAWSQAVAHPILKALDIQREDYFGGWIDAAEEDARGLSHLSGMYPLCQAIAALRTEDVVQPLEGSWFTAAEIRERLMKDRPHVLSGASHDREYPDARGLTFILKRIAGARQEGAAGTFVLETGRMSLGARTDRKARPVFRVRRSADAKINLRALAEVSGPTEFKPLADTE